MATTDAITFPAQVQKVQTLADGGIRVTLDLPETAIPQMAMLAECKRVGMALTVEVREDKEIVLSEISGL